MPSSACCLENDMSFLPDHALDHLRHVTETPDFSATRYRLEEEIGRGGMGIVYQAWDSQLERAALVLQLPTAPPAQQRRRAVQAARRRRPVACGAQPLRG